MLVLTGKVVVVVITVVGVDVVVTVCACNGKLAVKPSIDRTSRAVGIIFLAIFIISFP